ncbi:MAG: S41 family peptidase [Acidobacteria bacterium]|nr:S41 family peptidase [Acidobacteriota bacterium]
MSEKLPFSRSRGWWISIVVVVASATLSGGFFGDRLLGSPSRDAFDKRLKEYTELVSAAEEWAAEDPGTDKLVYSSIDGMLSTLDPHSSFFPPKDYSEMQQRQKGSFYGLGILVTKRNDQVTVITPLEGTPAARLGIRAGDIISEIEGEQTEGMPLDEVVGKLKGPKGTTVRIKIVRVGISEPIPLSIIREAIPTNSISNVLMVRNDVGYIRIKDFTYTTVRELDDAIASLKAKGMKRLILDLRTNPGGLLDAAVGVSDHFIDKGQMIVYTKGRAEEPEQEYRAPGKAERLDVPLVVLINRGSASASEIVAGAIQDHDRGLVVGETSWGKGLVQSVYSLQYGAGLALTTQKYYTPSGRNIQRDYSSFYDYYMAEEAAEPGQNGDSTKFETDTGRQVYSGGGITPDVVIRPRQLSATVQILEVRGAFFDFAVEYFARHPELSRDLTVSPSIVEEFVQRSVSKDIVKADLLREALAKEEERAYIIRTLRENLVAAKFGVDAAYPIRLEGDEQVAKAIELLPEASKLAIKSASLHAGAGSSAKNSERKLEAVKND